jgi:succinate dehydrogenase / fumarate reductase flavoprotein subunit
VKEKYGNLFDMYKQITGEDPYEVPMRIYPAVHYTMGGLWVDYNLMTTVPGLYSLGEANFSDHGANRLGASALMQGLADGYFVIPYTIGGYFAGTKLEKLSASAPEFEDAKRQSSERIHKLLSVKGKRTVSDIHRELGHIMWEYVGMGRNKAGLEKALEKIPALREEFWQNVNVLGSEGSFNQNLEHAGRVADFLEFAELLATDALHREESCGGHFRSEYQTEEGEALRQDDKFSYVACWHYQGEDKDPELLKEPLDYEFTERKTRNYKE